MTGRFALCMGAALAVAALALPATAHNKIKDIRCEQFLAMDADTQDDVVYWLHGATAGANKKTVYAGDIEVGYDRFGRPIEEVVIACTADKNASLIDKIRKHF